MSCLSFATKLTQKSAVEKKTPLIILDYIRCIFFYDYDANNNQ